MARSTMRSPARILIVDDSPVNAQMARAILDDAGYQVKVSGDAEDALYQLKKFPADLLLVDVMLPGMSGFDLARKVRLDQRKNSFLPIIFITARQDIEVRREALASGGNDLVVKPFDSLELLARIAVNLETKFLHDRLVETNTVLEKERDEVARIQRRLIPSTLPKLPGYAFASGYEPSSKAGGDYFDAFVREDGRIALVIADVSGHGLHSALYMSMLRALLNANLRKRTDLPEIFEDVSRVMSETLSLDEFITLLFGLLTPEDGTFEFVNAGHCPPLVVSLSGEEPSIYHDCPGPVPMGILEDNPAVTNRIEVPPGSRLMLFTDGVIETQDAQSEVFGLERLQDCADLNRAHHPAAFGRDVLRALHHFSGGMPHRDDVTFLIVDRLA